MEKDKEKPVEQQTADTILQRPVEVKAGGHTYTIAPPTLATMIAISATAAKLPEIAATLIIGEGGGDGRRPFPFLRRKPGDSRIRTLADRLLHTCGFEDIHRILTVGLAHQKIDFF